MTFDFSLNLKIPRILIFNFKTFISVILVNSERFQLEIAKNFLFNFSEKLLSLSTVSSRNKSAAGLKIHIPASTFQSDCNYSKYFPSGFYPINNLFFLFALHSLHFQDSNLINNYFKK